MIKLFAILVVSEEGVIPIKPISVRALRSNGCFQFTTAVSTVSQHTTRPNLAPDSTPGICAERRPQGLYAGAR
jgi:hypothetical protein